MTAPRRPGRPYGSLTDPAAGPADLLARDLAFPCHLCGAPLLQGEQIADAGRLPYPRRRRRADGTYRPAPRRIAHAVCVGDPALTPFEGKPVRR